MIYECKFPNNAAYHPSLTAGFLKILNAYDSGPQGTRAGKGRLLRSPALTEIPLKPLKGCYYAYNIYFIDKLAMGVVVCLSEATMATTTASRKQQM